MKITFYITLFSLFLIFAGSCKNDLDINDTPEEKAAVYCLLDQTKPIQYVRVSKVFLVDYDVNEAAKKRELMEYGKELVITLSRIDRGIVQETETLEIETGIPKDPGFFYSPDQILYKSTTLKLIPGDNIVYRLELYNTQQVDGKNYRAVAETRLIDMGNGIIKFPGKPYNSNNSQMVLVGASPAEYNQNFALSFNSGKNGAQYHSTVRLHYRERPFGGKVFTKKYSDWEVEDIYPPSLSGGEPIKSIFSGYRFYEYYGMNIPVQEGIQRIADSVEFIITAIDDNVKTFMEVNQPSGGMVIDKPGYSNITNGIGIFGARTTIRTVAKTLIPTDTKNGNKVFHCGMNIPSGDSLSCGLLTRKLNFATYYLTVATNHPDTVSCP